MQIDLDIFKILPAKQPLHTLHGQLDKFVLYARISKWITEVPTMEVVQQKIGTLVRPAGLG